MYRVTRLFGIKKGGGLEKLLVYLAKQENRELVQIIVIGESQSGRDFELVWRELPTLSESSLLSWGEHLLNEENNHGV